MLSRVILLKKIIVSIFGVAFVLIDAISNLATTTEFVKSIFYN